MKVAICGFPPLALQIKESLRNSNVEVKFFIEDLVNDSGGGINYTMNLPLITFFEFRRLVSAGELEGVLVAENTRSQFTKSTVQLFKLYEIPNVGVIQNSLIYWLDEHKIFLPYLESDITDICNLNCRGCYHFANFSVSDDIYPLKDFRRDMRQISQQCDIVRFRLLGGEPFLLKNLDEYAKISREYLPKAHLQILSNGLPIPSTSQKILNVLRENNFSVSISVYPPTLKMLDKIKHTLETNRIPYFLSKTIDKFLSRMTLNGNHDPLKTRRICSSDVCRTMFNGKIYKCPIDLFTFKFAKKFGVENFPAATSADIYATNLSSTLEYLDGNIELCFWCGDKHRQIPWERSTAPKLEDWLAEPDELKNFVGG